MEVIHIYAGPNELKELVKGGASYGHSRLVRCQVAGDNVSRTRNQYIEIAAATQVDSLIDDLRLTEVWISSGGVCGGRAGGVAAIAASLNVDDVAAKSDQSDVLPIQIQRYWR